jgi:hypothetical protein
VGTPHLRTYILGEYTLIARTFIHQSPLLSDVFDTVEIRLMFTTSKGVHFKSVKFTLFTGSGVRGTVFTGPKICFGF